MDRAEDRRGICLCVLFTHPYPANLPLLRKIYQGRFSHVRFLMPLVRSAEEDVLTVYRGSYAHHSYLGDHWQELRTLACAYYVLIQDDVLLSPWVDEHNILDALGIRGLAEGSIGTILPMPADVGEWQHPAGSLWRMLRPGNVVSGTGTESLATVLAQLPPADEAARLAAAHGVPPTTTFSYTERTLAPEHHLPHHRLFDGEEEDDVEFMRCGDSLHPLPSPSHRGGAPLARLGEAACRRCLPTTAFVLRAGCRNDGYRRSAKPGSNTVHSATALTR